MMPAPSERIVVLGAGQAGGWAAMTLRNGGFAGEVVLVGEEPYLPYERPPLSKAVLAGQSEAADTALFAADDFAAKGIEWRRGRVIELLLDPRRLVFEGGGELPFDRLIMTTGSRVRRLPVPGADLSGVHYLRTLEDAERLRQTLEPGVRLLVIGGGWIGLEVAATASALGGQVTLVEYAGQLCARTLDEQPARYLERLHRELGVEVRLNTSVQGLQGMGRVEAAQLSDGSVLPVDAVVVGIGVLPNAELAAQAGLAVDDGILVDGHGRTSVPEIYAAGDVSRHPNPFCGHYLRLETWENAQNQGIHVANAMLGLTQSEYAEVPWVWSDQYDCNIQSMGFPPAADDLRVLRGSPESGSFTLAYLRGGRLWGAVAINQGRELKAMRKLMQAGVAVTPELLQLPVPAMMKLLRG
ncbi:MAG: FAD-dependent oxidoreductase [Pseudomonas sp.]|nr:FAD-dependent oxidoreductase [Pseudomonas sp.]